MNTIATACACLLAAGLSIATVTALPGCSESAPAIEEADLTTLNFSVEGMSCEGCVASVRNAIAGIDGVSSCDVSLANGSAVVKALDASVTEEILEKVSALEFTIQSADPS